MNNTDDIKQLCLYLMLGGKEIKTEQLIHALTILADLSKIGEEIDFKTEGISRLTTPTPKGNGILFQSLHSSN